MGFNSGFKGLSTLRRESAGFLSVIKSDANNGHCFVKYKVVGVHFYD